MRHIILVLFIGLLSLGISSCQKVEEPQKVGHKFTYYGVTDGQLAIRYSDNTGAIHQVYVNNEEWHITFNVNIGDTMYIEMIPTMQCYMGYYFAQDGVITHQEKWKLRQAYYGIISDFIIK